MNRTQEVRRYAPTLHAFIGLLSLAIFTAKGWTDSEFVPKTRSKQGQSPALFKGYVSITY